MAILNVPYTLVASQIFPKVSTLIVETRPVDAIKSADWRDRFLSAFEKGTIEYGNGFQYVFDTKDGTVEDLDFNDGSTLLDLRRPKMKTVAITIDTFKRFPISVTKLIEYTHFENLGMVEASIGLQYVKPERTAKRFFCDIGMNLVIASNALQQTFTFTDTSTMTSPSDVIAAKMVDYQKLVQLIEKSADDATVLSTTYTDGVTEQERNTGDLYFLYNRKYINELKATVLAPLFKGEVIMSMANVKEAVEAPEAFFAQHNIPNYICGIYTYEKLNLIYKFLTSRSFVNGSIATETIFYLTGSGHGEVPDFFGTSIWDGAPPTSSRVLGAQIKLEAVKRLDNKKKDKTKILEQLEDLIKAEDESKLKKYYEHICKLEKATATIIE